MQWDPGVDGKLRYSPSATFSGITQIFVTVGDATGIASRHVVATVTVAVYGPPTRPTVAPIVSARTDAVTNTPFFSLDWSAGPALPRGAAIDHYQVNWSGGDRVDATCLSSGPRCGFAGLSFARSYSFRVRAVDVYREPGDWGPASASQRYDVAPPAVASATAEFDLTSSTSIDVAWTPRNAHAGSAIRFYDIYIGTQLRTSVPAPRTTAQIDGLVTGQPYEFTIKTRNASDERSEGVTTTPPVRPLAVPTFVPAPVVSESLNVNDSVEVSWPIPTSPMQIAATGGDDPVNLDYFVIIDGGTPQPATSPGFFSFSNPVEGHTYQIELGVVNSLVAKNCHAALSSCARVSRWTRVVHHLRPAVAGHRSRCERERAATAVAHVHAGQPAGREPGRSSVEGVPHIRRSRDRGSRSQLAARDHERLLDTVEPVNRSAVRLHVAVVLGSFEQPDPPVLRVEPRKPCRERRTVRPKRRHN